MVGIATPLLFTEYMYNINPALLTNHLIMKGMGYASIVKNSFAVNNFV